MTDPRLELRSAPHLHAAQGVEQIMRNVVLALLPLCAFGVFLFGLSAAALIVVVTLSCLGTEQLFNRLAGRAGTLGDYSAAITGMLLALTLPPAFPLWMGAVSGFVAIGLGKALFGGLGFNVFNPALVGRAFAQAAFPAAVTDWSPVMRAGRFLELQPSSLSLPFMAPPESAVIDVVTEPRSIPSKRASSRRRRRSAATSRRRSARATARCRPDSPCRSSRCASWACARCSG